MSVLDQLTQHPIVPVVEIEALEHALPLAETLLDAGLGAIEITLRTQAALAAIETIRQAQPDLLVGAGSVRQEQQRHDALAAGAQFLVSPGFSPALSQNSPLPLIPGVSSASEIMQAMHHGHSLLKFFPAELSGGVTMLQALSGPLPEVKFFPTGGIGPHNVEAYLALPQVQCVGGTWVAPKALISSAQFEQIAHIARSAVLYCKR